MNFKAFAVRIIHKFQIKHLPYKIEIEKNRRTIFNHAKKKKSKFVESSPNINESLNNVALNSSDVQIFYFDFQLIFKF